MFARKYSSQNYTCMYTIQSHLGYKNSIGWFCSLHFFVCFLCQAFINSGLVACCGEINIVCVFAGCCCCCMLFFVCQPASQPTRLWTVLFFVFSIRYVFFSFDSVWQRFIGCAQHSIVYNLRVLVQVFLFFVKKKKLHIT